MFGKGKANEENQAQALVHQPQRPPVAKPAAESAEAVSSLSSGMTIVGKFVGDGVVKIYGRMEGELHASTVLIAEGAIVEGNVIAQELTIGGRVKGAIHANRVKLNSTAVVEGDIFHGSLSIEENARFEGSSHREDNAIDAPSGGHVRVSIPQASAQPQPPALTQVMLVDGNRKSNSTHGNGEAHQSAEVL